MTTRIFKLRNVAMIVCLAVMTMFSACSKDPEKNPDSPDNPDEPDNPIITMINMEIKGIVNDVKGKPLSGVKVTTGTVNATTGADGTFSFTQAEVVNERVKVKLEKSGYFTLMRSGAKADNLYIEAVLTPKGATDNSLQTTFDAAVGATLQVAGAKVVISPSGIMKKDGSAYSGTVKVDMRYLDPYTKDFSSMMAGGNHAGINKAGEDVILISFGIIGVEFTDNQNNPLQLKSGLTADVTWPVPSGMKGTLPTTVPVSTFDEQKGVWVEEIVATLQGEVYTGKVTHFSYYDLGPLKTGKETKIIKGRVQDCEGKPIPGAGVFVDAGIFAGGIEASPLDFIRKADGKGEWQITIPEDREVYKLAAWTDFEDDDKYTEKWTWEGGVKVYISKLCDGDGWGKVAAMDFSYSEAMWQSNNTSLMIFNPNNAPNSGDYVIINFKNMPAKLAPGTYTYTNGLSQITSFGVWIDGEVILVPWPGLGCTLTLDKNASGITYSITFSTIVSFHNDPGRFIPFDLFYSGKINGLD